MLSRSTDVGEAALSPQEPVRATGNDGELFSKVGEFGPVEVWVVSVAGMETVHGDLSSWREDIELVKGEELPGVVGTSLNGEVLAAVL